MRLVLEKVFDENGKHLGDVIVFTEKLTPEFMTGLKNDKLADSKGWLKYHQVLKENGFDVELA